MPGFVLTHETNTAFFVIALVLHKSHKSQCNDLTTSTGSKVDLSKVHVTTSHRETVSCRQGRNMKMFDTGMTERTECTVVGGGGRNSSFEKQTNS